MAIRNPKFQKHVGSVSCTAFHMNVASRSYVPFLHSGVYQHSSARPITALAYFPNTHHECEMHSDSWLYEWECRTLAETILLYSNLQYVSIQNATTQRFLPSTFTLSSCRLAHAAMSRSISSWLWTTPSRSLLQDRSINGRQTPQHSTSKCHFILKGKMICWNLRASHPNDAEWHPRNMTTRHPITQRANHGSTTLTCSSIGSYM